jgi:hypothetical protein
MEIILAEEPLIPALFPYNLWYYPADTPGEKDP